MFLFILCFKERNSKEKHYISSQYSLLVFAVQLISHKNRHERELQYFNPLFFFLIVATKHRNCAPVNHYGNMLHVMVKFLCMYFLFPHVTAFMADWFKTHS